MRQFQDHSLEVEPPEVEDEVESASERWPGRQTLLVPRGKRAPSLEPRWPGRETISGRLRRKAAATPSPTAAIAPLLADATRGTGSPLPTTTRRGLERALGVSLADVRIHTSSESASAAAALGAHAFAFGQDVHFAAGTYDPHSVAGRRLIAHEVAHTVQERGATTVIDDGLSISAPGDSHEAEADDFADAFTRSDQTDQTDQTGTLVTPETDGPLLVQPVRAGTVSRSMVHCFFGAPGAAVNIPYPSIDVFDASTLSRSWALNQRFRPVDTPIMIGEIPARAGVTMAVNASASLNAGYGPGVIRGSHLQLSGAEAALLAGSTMIPLPGSTTGTLLGILAARDHTGTGTFTVPVFLDARFTGRGEVAGELSDITRSLTLAGYGGLEVNAAADGRVEPSVALTFTYRLGRGATFAVTSMAYHIDAGLLFRISAFAGVRASFQLNIDLLDRLTRRPSFWPGFLPWPLSVIPTASNPWRRQWEKRWTLFEHRSRFTMDGDVAGGASAGTPTRSLNEAHSQGDLVGALNAMAGSAPGADNFPAQDEGPTGAGAANRGEVSRVRAAARSTLSLAGQAIASQLATALRPPAAASTRSHGRAGHATPRPAAHGAASRNPQVQRLHELERAKESLTNQVDNLDDAASATDPGSLGAVKSGYETAERGADGLRSSADSSGGGGSAGGSGGGGGGGGGDDELERARAAAETAVNQVERTREVAVAWSGEEIRWVDNRMAAAPATVRPILQAHKSRCQAYQREVEGHGSSIETLRSRYQDAASSMSDAELREIVLDDFRSIKHEAEALAHTIEGIVRPVRPAEAEADDPNDRSHVMRFQVQYNTARGGGGPTFSAVRSASAARGVTVAQATDGLFEAWDKTTPAAAKTAAESAREDAISWCASKPPGGISTENFSHSSAFEYGGYTDARVDVENMHGHNLRE